MALADDKHLALATVSGDVDLSTAQGRLAARLKGAVARHEIDQMKARQRRKHRQKAEQGLPHWTRAFGYLADARHPTRRPPRWSNRLTRRVGRLVNLGDLYRCGMTPARSPSTAARGPRGLRRSSCASPATPDSAHNAGDHR